MIEDEICSQTGLMSVLIFLLDNNGCNQKTLLMKTKASTITIYRIQNLLLKYKLIELRKSDIYNQNLYCLTEKGKKAGLLFKEIRDLISS